MHEIVNVAYACELMWLCVEFWDEILLRREECKTLENLNFLRNSKMVNSVKRSRISLDLG